MWSPATQTNKTKRCLLTPPTQGNKLLRPRRAPKLNRTVQDENKLGSSSETSQITANETDAAADQLTTAQATGKTLSS